MVAMAALPTFTDGVVVTAASLNALKAQIDALSQVATGKPVATGHAAKPAAKVRLLNTQLVPNRIGGSQTNTGEAVVSWDVDDYDTDHLWNTADKDHFLVRTPGWYRVRMQVTWDFSATADAATVERVCQITVNGTVDNSVGDGAGNNVVASSNTLMGDCTASIEPEPARPIRQQCSALVRCEAGTTIYGQVFQSSQTTYTVQGGSGNVTLSGLYLLPNTRWGCWMSASWERQL